MLAKASKAPVVFARASRWGRGFQVAVACLRGLWSRAGHGRGFLGLRTEAMATSVPAGSLISKERVFGVQGRRRLVVRQEALPPRMAQARGKGKTNLRFAHGWTRIDSP